VDGDDDDDDDGEDRVTCEYQEDIDTLSSCMEACVKEPMGVL